MEGYERDRRAEVGGHRARTEEVIVIHRGLDNEIVKLIY